MAKKVAGSFRMVVFVRDLKPQQIGQTVGKFGLNPGEFTKVINEATASMEDKARIPVYVTAYSDRSFTYTIGSPFTSYLLKRAAGVKTASATPHTVKVGSVTRAQLEEIVSIKNQDQSLTASELDAAVRTIAGTARSMGIDVEGV